MEDHFKLVEWESQSKKQEILVQQLFGEVTSFKKPTVLTPSERVIAVAHEIDSDGIYNRGNIRSVEYDDLEAKRKRKAMKGNKGDKVVDICTSLENFQGSSAHGGRFGKSVENGPSKVKKKGKRVKKNDGDKLPDEQDFKNITLTDVEKSFDEEVVLETNLKGEYNSATVQEYPMSKKTRRMKKKEKKVDDSERKCDYKTLATLESLGEAQFASCKTSKEKRTELVDVPVSRSSQNNVSCQQEERPACFDDPVFSCHTSQDAAKDKLSFHDKMVKRLESSRFRWINEQLYTTTGDEALKIFSEDPSLFDIYHRGFSNQVKLWPINPVDLIIKWLKTRPSSLVVADFGCGEAVLAHSIPNKVHSFDLVAKNKFVTSCDMANVPLPSSSVDVAVFCLSLMGTNLVEYLKEAHRVLKPGGILKVAEVASRISDATEFCNAVSKLGFQLQLKDSSSKMFLLFEFFKVKGSVKPVPNSKLRALNLKPCIYKKR